MYHGNERGFRRKSVRNLGGGNERNRQSLRWGSEDVVALSGDDEGDGRLSLKKRIHPDEGKVKKATQEDDSW